MIESFNLYQQVREITHEKGHILDLVLANNDSQTFKISNIRVEQCGISDHHIVLFNLMLINHVLFIRRSTTDKQKTSIYLPLLMTSKIVI